MYPQPPHYLLSTLPILVLAPSASHTVGTVHRLGQALHATSPCLTATSHAATLMPCPLFGLPTVQQSPPPSGLAASPSFRMQRRTALLALVTAVQPLLVSAESGTMSKPAAGLPAVMNVNHLQ